MEEERLIPETSFKTLNAPGLLNEYYFNLLDWNSANILCFALGSSVYLFNANNGETEELKGDNERIITSLAWIQKGNYLAIGDEDGCVRIWDASQNKQIRKLEGHHSRVG